MRRPHPLGIALALVAAMAPTTPAAARPQDRPPPTLQVATEDRVGTLHKEGARLFEQGKYQEALAPLNAAWAIEKRPRIAVDLGQCEIKLGRLREAAEHFSFALSALPPEDRSFASQKLEETLTKIGSVSVSADQPGVMAVVGGRSLGEVSKLGPVFVEPGPRMVEGRKPGYVVFRKILDVQPGSKHVVSMTLERPRTEPPPKLPVLIAGTALTLTALGLEFGLFALGDAKKSDADKQRAAIAMIGPCPAASIAQCSHLRSTLATGARFYDAAIVDGVSGSVIGIATLVYFFVPLPSGPRQEVAVPVRIAPSIGSSGGGVVVNGTF